MFQNASGLVLVCCIPLLAQNQPPPSFEAASVKLNKSGETRMAVDFQPGGKFSAQNAPLRILIALAYHVRPDFVTGGEGWLASERFDIVAKASQTAPPDELRRMLQGLLAERFKLEIHSDQKLMPAFALLVGKTGPKLQPAEAGLLTERRCRAGDPIPGQKHVVCEHMTMALMADTLQEIATRDIDVPVVDQTGIAGAHTFQLAWTPAVRSAAADPPGPAAGPTLFQAMEEQLGLKLESRKLPLPVIVIDKVERLPFEN